MKNADYAFQEATKELWGQKSAFHPLKGFDDTMPYFCLRIPTGGGKTFVAAKSVGLINQQLLHTEHSVILWLVPSTAIRTQTLDALKQLDHPYHKALKDAGAVTVIDLDEAKNLNRSTLETSTVVIVATRQAFQVGNEDLRKVYESSGALMPLFDGLTASQRGNLETDSDGNIPYSLTNALRLRRPFIIVDEAHNSRTELSFETLAKFHPSGIMELTATPDMDNTPSNVLHTVSAVELKAEEMIKLPIQLETVPDAQKCLSYAIDLRLQLETAAVAERAAGAPYLRPLVLIQAEVNSSTKQTRNTKWVKDELIINHNIPEDNITIATGSERGLEDLEKEFKGGIFSEQCPVKFIITQKALAEGWDCPFAYILVSMAELKSSTAIEQLLGRILRQPNAKCFAEEALNKSYAFVVSNNFSETANSLRDRLVEGAGFKHREANEFVAARQQAALALDTGRTSVKVTQVTIAIPESPDLNKVSDSVKKKVQWDKKSQELTIKEPLSKPEEEELKEAFVMDVAREAVGLAVAKSHESVTIFQSPADKGELFKIPQLSVIIDGELRLFDEPEAIDYPWELPCDNTKPTAEDLSEISKADNISDGGLIDVTEAGNITTLFVESIERDLNLVYKPENWTEAKLVSWFCQQVKDPSITHQSKVAFIREWITQLLNSEIVDLPKINRHKFLIRTIIEQHVFGLRKEAISKACQEFLFAKDVEKRVTVGGEDGYEFIYDQISYAPIEDYDGQEYEFSHHFYERIGKLDSKEETLCAQWIDQQAAKGVFEYWVRNLEGKRPGAFFLQTATGRFYPDFICKLKDGRILVIEYKGAHLWDGAEEKRKIGKLWAELSNGKCLFVMVKNKEWSQIESIY